MARLPSSLMIALWIVGSTWALAIVAWAYGYDMEYVWAAFAFGIVAGVMEWMHRREGGR